MTFTNRVLLFLACLAVSAVAQANALNTPPKRTAIAGWLSMAGMVGVVAVATGRYGRKQQSPEPLTDAGRKRLKVAAVCSWLSMVLLGVAITAVIWLPSRMSDALSLWSLGVGFVAAIAGYVISIREGGNIILSAIPFLSYVLPVVLFLVSRS